jgi:hypothetical protein
VTTHTFQPVTTPAINPHQEIVNTLSVAEIIDIFGIMELNVIMTDRDVQSYMRLDRWADLWSDDSDEIDIAEPPVRTLPSGEVPRSEFRLPLRYRKPDRNRDRRRS